MGPMDEDTVEVIFQPFGLGGQVDILWLLLV
jgi:hypothetical protein